MKNPNKHTPGPWVLSKTSHLKDFGYFIDDRVGHDGKTPSVAAIAERQEAIANAKLIAAAPELLDACRFMLGSENLTTAQLAILREVVAKAVGGGK